MKNNSVLMLGCGDLGIRTGRILLQQGWSVTGLRRNPGHLPAEFSAHALDYTLPDSLGLLSQLQPDYVVATFTPEQRNERGYRLGFTRAAHNLLRGLGDHTPRALLMVSSTRVYAEADGGWVDEGSALDHADPMTCAIVEAEQILLESRVTTCVVRFAGIYGASDGRLLQRIRRGQICPAAPLRYSNRIHREDCAGFLAHLLSLTASGETLEPVYTGVDDLPAPRAEVERWLLEELGVQAAIQESAPLGDSHRRCRNTRLRQSGYRLQYPDYRSGYRALIRSAS